MSIRIVGLNSEQLSLLRTICKINRSRAVERMRAYRALDCERAMRDTERLVSRYDTLLFLFKEDKQCL